MEKFEIRVAIFGYVSVGKTTVINALLGAEYGEVSMRRTTSTVNSFRLVPKDEATTQDGDDDSVQIVTNTRSAKDILEESVEDNAKNRNNEVVKEKTFNITLEEPLHDMRDDTILTIVDIPGINEAGTSSKYKDYVNDHWHSFDIAVVVMDGRQGVNTEEQLDLLQLAKSNSEKIREIPIIIVCNKVDDPDNAEQRVLLKEACGAVEKLFDVSDRDTALADLLDECQESVFNSLRLPAVVPISAMHAFLYRSGSKLTLEEFCKMDPNFIESIGKESYGRQWRRYGRKKKLEMAFKAVSDEEERQDGLEASNFESFLKVLSYCVGGKDRQQSIVRQQLEVSLDRMKNLQGECDLGAEIFASYTKLTALGSPTDHLGSSFWTAYEKLVAGALNAFDTDLSPRVFANPLSQLASFSAATKKLGLLVEHENIIQAAKEFVLKYAAKVFDNESKLGEHILNLRLVFGSMQMLSCDPLFSLHFGLLKLELDYRYLDAMTKWTNNSKNLCLKCGCQTRMSGYQGIERCIECGTDWVERGQKNCPQCCRSGYSDRSHLLSFKKVSGDFSRLTSNFQCKREFYCRDAALLIGISTVGYSTPLASVVVPDSLDHPDHFGYPLWKCCRLIESVCVLEDDA